MGAEGGGREEELPAPLAGGVGVLAQQGFREMDIARADGQILQVFLAGGIKVISQCGFQGPGQRYHAVLAVLTVVDGDGSLAEVEILDPQGEAFHEPQAGAIHDEGGEFPDAVQMGEDRTHLVTGHDHGRAAVATRGGDRLIDGEILDAKDLAGEEDDGIEGLFPRGGRNPLLQSEMVEVGGNGCGARRLGSLLELSRQKRVKRTHQWT